MAGNVKQNKTKENTQLYSELPRFIITIMKRISPMKVTAIVYCYLLSPITVAGRTKKHGLLCFTKTIKTINVSHVKKNRSVLFFFFFFYTGSQLIIPADSLFASELEKSKGLRTFITMPTCFLGG